MTLAVWDVVTAAPIAFVIGVAVGLGLSSRYAIIRRNDRNHHKEGKV